MWFTVKDIGYKQPAKHCSCVQREQACSWYVSAKTHMLMCGQHAGKKHVLYTVYDKATSTSPNHCATLEEQ